MTTHTKIILALGTFALALPAVRAAEGDPGITHRALDGHVFQPSQLITGPFNTTSIGMATLAGTAQATAPTYDIFGNQTGTKKYTLGTYGQNVDLDVRVTPDIGLHLAVNALAFSGTDARGLLVAGATVQVGFLAGLTAGKTFNHDKMRIAFVLDGGIQPQLSVLIGNAVINSLQTRIFNDNGLLSDVKRLRLGPGGSFAWALSPAVGLEAEMRYVFLRRTTNGGESSEGGDRNSQGLSAGALASLDFDPLFHFPIALQASYRGDFPTTSGGTSEVQQAGLGAFYSRRVHLALGLEGIWRHGDIRPGVRPTLKADSEIAVLWLRYYW